MLISDQTTDSQYSRRLENSKDHSQRSKIHTGGTVIVETSGGTGSN